MVAITVRNVDPAVRDKLAERARISGKSLEEYVHGLLTETAAKRPLAEIFAEAAERVRAEGSRVTAEEIVQSLREDRDDPGR